MVDTMKRGCDHLFFIGFLGAGKSTLARSLGSMFNRRYVDIDRMVERACGLRIDRIFSELGEGRFRELETSTLRSLESERSLLVSCGGGIVETPENIELMRSMGYCVYLEGDIDDCLRQIRSTRGRPDFVSPAHAVRLLRHRRPLYERAADVTIDIRGKSFQEVSYISAEILVERGLL